jgi:hypothetical protein
VAETFTVSRKNLHVGTFKGCSESVDSCRGVFTSFSDHESNNYRHRLWKASVTLPRFESDKPLTSSPEPLRDNKQINVTPDVHQVWVHGTSPEVWITCHGSSEPLRV